MWIYGLYDSSDRLIYVGQTSQSPHVRLRNHMVHAKRGMRLPLCNWLRKHGKPSLKVLEEVNTREEANMAERLHIANGVNLLNVSPGGWDGLRGQKRPKHSLLMRGRTNPAVAVANRLRWTTEAKQQLAERMRRDNPMRNPDVRQRFVHPRGMFGKHHTKEVRARIASSMCGSKNHFFGKKHTDETRAKMCGAR